MYKPLFNTVLVEIDDTDARWGTGNDDSMMGKSYRFGKIIDVGDGMATKDYPETMVDAIATLKGADIMWNEGVEAGTLFDDGDKQYGFIYWWDIRGVKE